MPSPPVASDRRHNAHDTAGLAAAASVDELRRANAHLSTMLRSLGDGLLVADTTGTVRYLNPAAEQITGWVAREAVGRPIGEVYPVTADAVEGPLLHGAALAILTARDGERLIVDQTITPLRDATPGEDACSGTVYLFRDVTAQHHTVRRMRYQATHDALTGLHNRYEFERRLQGALDEAQRDGTTHAVLYLDLDHFKDVNDRAGHAAGDQLLGSIGERLRRTVRAGDCVARLGGDEFAVLLHACSEEKAIQLAERLRRAVHQLRFQRARRVYRISVSMGLACLDAHQTSAEAALEAADTACYAAKRAGGNGLCIAPADGAPPALTRRPRR